MSKPWAEVSAGDLLYLKHYSGWVSKIRDDYSKSSREYIHDEEGWFLVVEARFAGETDFSLGEQYRNARILEIYCMTPGDEYWGALWVWLNDTSECEIVTHIKSEPK